MPSLLLWSLSSVLFSVEDTAAAAAADFDVGAATDTDATDDDGIAATMKHPSPVDMVPCIGSACS